MEVDKSLLTFAEEILDEMIEAESTRNRQLRSVCQAF